MILKKFLELKASKEHNEGSETQGSQHMSHGSVIPETEEMPRWEDALADEASQDRHSTWKWAFTQQGRIGKNVEVDFEKKEIARGASKKINHAHNQSRMKKIMHKLWVLSGSQSAWDAITSNVLAGDIQKYKWALHS